VRQAGSAFGLQVTLNVHRQEYYGVTSSQTGFKILIHHQGTPPMVSQLGFAVGPGTSTFAAIRKQRVRNYVTLDRFSIQCRKTKTKVITLANHKRHRQYNEPINTRSNYM